MRRSDREISGRAEQEALLDAASVVRVGLWDGAEPYVVPLNFVRVDGALFFHSAAEGRKIGILRDRPRVCFEVEGPSSVEIGSEACDCTTRYVSVIGWGVATFLETAAEKAEVLAGLNRKFGAAEGPFSESMLARVAVVRIDIERMTGKANRGR